MKKQCISGSAIAVTLIAIAAMTTVALGVAQLVPRDFRQSEALENSLTAENAAWSGVERALFELKQNPFYEQSQESSANQGRPYGDVLPNGCASNAANCGPGVNRQLGIPKNQTPVSFTNTGNPAADLGLATDVGYSTVVWHMEKQVGNPADLNDGSSDNSRTSSNINPILERDATRTLDATTLNDIATGINGVTIHWAPIFHTKSDQGFSGDCIQSGNKFYVSYVWLDDQGQPITRISTARNLLDFDRAGDSNYPIPNDAGSKRLRITFLATSPNGNDLTSPVADCFMRYSLQPAGVNDGIDLGLSVIESTGYSGNVRRKVRVLVDRQNGAIVNIFDFGVACQTCKVTQ